MIYQMMTKVIQQWLLPPVFPDKEQTRAARWLNFLILFLIFLILADSVAILIGLLDQDALASILITNAIALLVNLIALLLMRYGYVNVASFILLGMIFSLITYYYLCTFLTED